MNRPANYFLAIPLPASHRSQIEAFQQQFAPHYPFQRWTHPEDTHITLHFFGSLQAEELERIRNHFAQVSPARRPLSPFSLRIGWAGSFGQQERPRIFWLGVKGDLPPLHRLHEQVGREVDTLGFPREKRPYRPHITLARRYQGEGFDLEQLNRALKAWPHLMQLQAPFQVDHFVLYQTCFGEKPMYRILQRLPLN